MGQHHDAMLEAHPLVGILLRRLEVELEATRSNSKSLLWIMVDLLACGLLPLFLSLSLSLTECTSGHTSHPALRLAPHLQAEVVAMYFPFVLYLLEGSSERTLQHLEHGDQKALPIVCIFLFVLQRIPNKVSKAD